MDSTKPRSNRPKSRQSLAVIPSSRPTVFDTGNATTDLSAISRASIIESTSLKRKVRGKSIGPGGLEALTETSGNVTKNISSFAIKSILKPAIPITPPKNIPSFDDLQKKSSAKTKSPGPKHAEDLLIDFSTPAPARENGASISQAGSEFVADPFSPMTRKSPRLQNGNLSQAQQQEDDARRKAEKQAILDRRAARRKSLANRRVSFAPEATLHTWSVMELPEDSTTSSASNSTRRQSTMTAAQSPALQDRSPDGDITITAGPSTPSEQIEDPLVKASPVPQRNLHQKKRRRSSSMSSEPDLDATMEQILSSSPAGDMAGDSSPIRIQEGVESEDDTDTDGDTAMDIDEATMTSQNSSSTQSSLDERLRNAANQAGTRGIQYDENGDDLPMEMITDTVTNALQPWMRDRGTGQENMPIDGQENTDSLSSRGGTGHSQSIPPGEQDEEQDETSGITMEMTKAIGGILQNQMSPNTRRRKSVNNPRRRSSVARRQSSGEASNFDDETMDMTTVAGGILQPHTQLEDEDSQDEKMAAEDMTMEFTNVIGGVLGRPMRRESLPSFESSGNETMDITVAVGGILAPIEEQTEPQTDTENDFTAPMEMTRVFGGLLAEDPHVELTEDPKAESSSLASIEASTTVTTITPSTPDRSQHLTSVASETGSPSLQLKPRLSGRSRATPQPSTTPKRTPQRSVATPTQTQGKLSTPKQQQTPLPTRAETPSKTPIAANIIHRSASPQKLFQAEIKARASPASIKKSNVAQVNPLFQRDNETGQHTPSVVLRATRPVSTRRRSSGIGMDRVGLGSPRVSEILDRRSSLAEATGTFKLQNSPKRSIRFQNPKVLEQEIDADRAEEHRRESGRFAMEAEANEQQDENATLQLKEMIASMSPQKKSQSKLKGRKSLAVGAAKGILGKRPAELDSDREDSADITPKRLKAVSRESSPVKKIHLPKPPTVAETTGRLSRAEKVRLEALSNAQTVTPSASVSPGRTSSANSPQIVSRYREVPPTSEGRPTSFEHKMDNVVGAIGISTAQTGRIGQDKEEEKVSLQAFLNMTNIHFIELSTTKRRHTLAQPVPHGTDSNMPTDFSTAQSAFVAAATTLPLLELYQHATKELKTYISSGRKIIRSIEAETWRDQPLLFREYIDARPDVKTIMDNQFRNGKSNARLQSKEGWYTWRSQLVDGLNAGLGGIRDGMLRDLTAVDSQQAFLDEIVPQLISANQSTIEELHQVKSTLEELDSIDHEVLRQSREELQAADVEFAEKTALLESLRQQMQDKDEALSAANELRTEMLEQISEADRVREELRGWPVQDVIDLKEKVAKLENEMGWRIITAEEDLDEPTDFGAALTLMYKKQLRLFFHPAMFQASDAKDNRRRSDRKSKAISGPSAPISLTMATDDGEGTAIDLPTEKRFFLQLIRSQLHAYAMGPRGSVVSRTLLKTVSSIWDMACKISEEVRLLNMCGVTSTSILGDEKLGLRVVLMTASSSRLDIEFDLSVSSADDNDIATSWAVNVRGVYGPDCEHLSEAKTRKVQQALTKELETRDLASGACVGAVHGFRAWLQKQNTVEKKESITKPATKQTSSSIPTSTNAVTSNVTANSTSNVPVAPTLQVPVTSSTTPAAARRSPLAPKKSVTLPNKKALPIPTQKVDKIKDTIIRSTASAPQDNKENQILPLTTSKMNGEQPASAAMPPEMQEVIMHALPMTPIKRIGALRRSPI